MRRRKLAYRLRRAERRAKVKARKRLAAFERSVNQSLWGSDTEPSWADLRNGARAMLLGSPGVDTRAVRRIWEDNKLLPAELRKTDPCLLPAIEHEPPAG